MMIADAMYLRWSKEKQALNMTSIFAELVLVAAKKNKTEVAMDAHKRLLRYAQEEWGEHTTVVYRNDSVVIENNDKMLTAKFRLNELDILVSETDIEE